MRWLQSFEDRGSSTPRRPHQYGSRNPIFKPKLGRISALTVLSFVQIRSADFKLQSYFQKYVVTRNSALVPAAQTM